MNKEVKYLENVRYMYVRKVSSDSTTNLKQLDPRINLW